jgi:hypothetical protein
VPRAGARPPRLSHVFKPNVVMVSARGQKCRRVPHPLGHREAEHVAIEAKRTLEVSNLEVDVAYAHLRIDLDHGRRMRGLGGRFGNYHGVSTRMFLLIVW